MNSPDLRTDVPHSSRIYDYLLGGKDNFQADRDAAAGITEHWPHLAISMRANRNYMARLVRHLAAEHGMRQFLDIGTGLPTSPNLHEVVQEVDPTSRVVYVDNGHSNPVVHTQAITAVLPAKGQEGCPAGADHARMSCVVVVY